MNARDFVDAVLKMDPANRAEYLVRACAGNEALLEEARALLKTSEDASASTVTIESAVSVDGPGSFIGPYKLVKEIGAGGTGVVYHAQQLQPTWPSKSSSRAWTAGR